MMDDFASETDSDYTSYWRDWTKQFLTTVHLKHASIETTFKQTMVMKSRDATDGVTAIGHVTDKIPENSDTLYDGGLLSPRRTIRSLSFSDRFISSRGNEYFCEIDEEYLTDRFNLTGLNADVQYYQYALDLVTDVFDLDCDDDMRDAIEKSARHLYGLVHARYITTTRGLQKMVDKYKKGEFGKCPRVMCGAVQLLPTGLSDLPHVQTVKLFCPKCEDLYSPKSHRHASIDGAYFGSSFQNILFQVYPALIPEKSIKRYEPRVFGFKVHAAAALQRWQDTRREEMLDRLKRVGIEEVFAGDLDDAMDEEDDLDDGGEL